MRVRDIKSQLNRCRYLVDVLSAGAAGADEVEGQFAFVNINGWSDLKHNASIKQTRSVCRRVGIIIPTDHLSRSGLEAG